MRRNTTWMAAAAVVVIGGTALAADRRVPSNDYPTIQAAVDAAAPGDKIVVARGVYNESVTVLNKNGLTFQGKGAVWEHVAPSRLHCLNATGDDIKVCGFTFRHGQDMLRITGNDAIVKSNVFRGGPESAVLITGARAEVTRNRIIGADDDGIQINGDDARVCRNTVTRVNGVGVQITGNDAVVERNNVTQLDDDRGVYVIGDRARVERNKVHNVQNECVDVQGNDAIIRRNRLSLCDGLVEVQGTGATIESNRLNYSAGDHAIELDSGDGALVRRNRIGEVLDAEGICAEGNDIRIETNRIQNVWSGSGIAVNGHGAEVVRNRVSFAHDGISVEGPFTGEVAVPSDDSVIENNILQDVDERGIDVVINGSDIRSNTVLRSGSDEDEGIRVTGDDNLIERCTVREAENDCFEVNGSRNVVRNCTASDTTGNGYKFENGSDNEIRNCSATRCDGEGLDNEAPGTIATNNTFLGNRLDVANDAGASFAEFTGNRFETGGETTPSEVD